MSDTFLTRAIHRDIHTMRNLADSRGLTGELFQRLTDRMLENLATLERSIEDAEPEEFFEVTAAGIRAANLDAPPAPEERPYGRLTCIEGGLT